MLKLLVDLWDRLPKPPELPQEQINFYSSDDEELGGNEVCVSFNDEAEEDQAQRKLIEAYATYIKGLIGREPATRQDLYCNMIYRPTDQLYCLDASHPIAEALLKHALQTGGEHACIHNYSNEIYTFRVESIAFIVDVMCEIFQANGKVLT